MSSSKPPVSDAKLAANRLNALKSTGPTSDTGKAKVGQNNLRHGLTGSFSVLASESATDYEELRQALHNEHQPVTPTEQLLVERMAQHHWLAQRALNRQNRCFESEETLSVGSERQLALYIRYQTTNERAFHKCLAELAKTRLDRYNEQVRREEREWKEAQKEREARQRREWREYWAGIDLKEKAKREKRETVALNRKNGFRVPPDQRNGISLNLK